MPPLATLAAEGPALTVYSSADPAGFNPQQFVSQQRAGRNPNFAWQVPGFGVVKEIREMVLEKGTNTLRFTDVAQFIDPTTVSFTDLTDRDGTSVLEQSFEFDLVSPSKLLEKYLGQDIAVIVSRGQDSERISGKLLSFNEGQLVLDTPKGVRIARSSNELELGDLPEGLITKPTLRWLVKAGKAGTHEVRTTYQTGGMTWRADYNLVVNQEDTEADLGAWVSLMNLSGASFPKAKLKLIAGDVQRVTPRGRQVAYRRQVTAMAVSEDAAFQEKSFFEYHLYTLPRRTDILDNSTQQLVLFPTARGIGIEKVLLYYGLPSPQTGVLHPTREPIAVSAPAPTRRSTSTCASKTMKRTDSAFHCQPARCVPISRTTPMEHWSSSEKTSSTTHQRTRGFSSSWDRPLTWSGKEPRRTIP